MKRSVLRFALPLLVLMSIPFIYNSCEGGMGKGFSAAAGASCKVGLENGKVTKMEFNDDLPPAVFAQAKVRLREDMTSNSTQAKASGPVMVAAGERLGVILDNTCLQKNQDSLDQSVIAKAVVAHGAMRPELDRQAYEWILEREYSDTEIETLAQREACVIGLSWNRNYEMQSAFNDPGLPSQKHLSSIRATAAYDLFYNATGGMTVGTGNAVILAAVDSGVDWGHPDIVNNMWANANGMGIDITTLGGPGPINYNPIDVSEVGHGTHVAGLLAAVSNNNQGVVGTMPYRAKIMAVKIFKLNAQSQAISTSQYLYNGIRFAQLNGAQVINLSVRVDAASDSLLEAAVTEAVQKGSVVTVVMGNSNTGQLVDGSSFSSIPGQYALLPGVIGVGSFDANTGLKSFFSNYSTTYAEIAAPGTEQDTTGIYSTLPRAMSSYGRLAGTSQAAPLVAAAAGMVIGIIREAYGVAPTPAEVERLLTTSAAKSTALAPYFKDGNKLDLMNLVQKINLDYPLTVSGGSVTLPNLGCAQ